MWGWSIRKIGREYPARELGPGEVILDWDFVTPKTDSPLGEYAMAKAHPIGVVTDRALFIIMPRTRDVMRLPSNLMDDVREGAGYLRIVVDDERPSPGGRSSGRSPGKAEAAHKAYAVHPARDGWKGRRFRRP